MQLYKTSSSTSCIGATLAAKLPALAIVLDKLQTNARQQLKESWCWRRGRERGYPSRLSLVGMRGRLSTDSPSGRDTGDPTERGAYHDILLCCQTEKCLLRMRDGVCSDVSGAAFNCGVPGERETDRERRPCKPRPGGGLPS